MAAEIGEAGVEVVLTTEAVVTIRTVLSIEAIEGSETEWAE
jgi:hypothetical protein